jgi:hypothetical protein
LPAAAIRLYAAVHGAFPGGCGGLFGFRSTAQWLAGGLPQSGQRVVLVAIDIHGSAPLQVWPENRLFRYFNGSRPQFFSPNATDAVSESTMTGHESHITRSGLAGRVNTWQN